MLNWGFNRSKVKIRWFFVEVLLLWSWWLFLKVEGFPKTWGRPLLYQDQGRLFWQKLIIFRRSRSVKLLMIMALTFRRSRGFLVRVLFCDLAFYGQGLFLWSDAFLITLFIDLTRWFFQDVSSLFLDHQKLFRIIILRGLLLIEKKWNRK